MENEGGNEGNRIGGSAQRRIGAWARVARVGLALPRDRRCTSGNFPLPITPPQPSIIVYRLAYNGDVAAGQLAVFQGASEAPISGSIGAERATRKNSQLAAAWRVALKMGRRLRCSSVTYRFRYAPSTASPARTALPTAHFQRNDITIICETVH